jgi:hypothetical protein
MTLEEWSYVSQIFGVVLVVITLIYLALQVRQGTQLLLSEARRFWPMGDCEAAVRERPLPTSDLGLLG